MIEIGEINCKPFPIEFENYLLCPTIFLVINNKESVAIGCEVLNLNIITNAVQFYLVFVN